MKNSLIGYTPKTQYSVRMVFQLRFERCGPCGVFGLLKIQISDSTRSVVDNHDLRVDWEVLRTDKSLDFLQH